MQTSTPAAQWDRVMTLGRQAQDPRLLQAQEPNRGELFTFAAGPLTVDLSNQKISQEALAALRELAQATGVPDQIRAMFDGQRINTTENRAVLHVALRADAQDTYSVDGCSVMDDVLSVREEMLSFAERVRTKKWLGATKKPISHVVHIGIGGSHLGPEMVVKALRPFANGPEIRFVANVDPADMSAALSGLDPETTLFVVASKTFTTQETMANARLARSWLTAALGDEAVASHFVAASTSEKEVKDFGISLENMFPFNDWVGGRFSLWSSIGLPIAIAVGRENFSALLDGARTIDQHFKSAPLEENLPITMALVDIWNRSALEMSGRVILPYAQDLAKLPDFLQQLEMESNGKSVLKDGSAAPHLTSAYCFGQAGTNGQHAFYEQLHQGPDMLPSEFIVPFNAHPSDEIRAPGQHQLLVMNALAQISALFEGRKTEDPHRAMSGGRPSTLIGMDQLTPYSLGALLALFEHKVAAAGFVLGINSFDQFGVELGKELATKALAGNTEILCPAARRFLTRYEP